MKPKNIVTSFIKFIAGRLPSWSIDEQVEVQSEQVYHYKLPANFLDLSPDFAQQYAERLVIPPQKLYYLSKIFVTWQGVVFRNLRVFLPSLQSSTLVSYFQEPMLLKQWVGKVMRVSTTGEVAIVHSQYAPENYFHWMIDSLQRLIVLRQYHPNASLIVLEPMTEFVEKTISALGFDKLMRLSKSDVLYLDKLIMPQHVAPLGHADPALVRLVRDELLLKLAGPTSKPTRKIFVSRERQQSRRVVNQASVSELLANYDFETIFFEDLSLQEQICIMQESLIIISVHGANLVNTIFMNPGSTVIELVSSALHSPIYWRLSAIFSLSYYVLPCASRIDEKVSFHSNADITVDIIKLEEILKSAEENSFATFSVIH